MDTTPVLAQPAPSITLDLLPDAVSKAMILGDLKGLTPQLKVAYYTKVCESLGINPMTQPFDYLVFQGRERLYANKNCAEQLRKIYGISVTDIKEEWKGDLLVIKVFVAEPGGRTDVGTAALSVKGLRDTDLANAIMKTETKAKRRATLSICSLGMLDESEVADNPRLFKAIPADKVHTAIEYTETGAVNTETGEVVEFQSGSTVALTGDSGDEWSYFRYAYLVPYKELTEARKQLLKGARARWRPAKDKATKEPIPGGDNAWYCDTLIKELSSFLIKGATTSNDDDLPASWNSSSSSDDIIIDLDEPNV
jgi:hypothetical protein